MQKLLKSPKTIKYLVAAILLAVPLYPKFPFIRIPGTYVSIRLEDFLLAFVALVLAFSIYPHIKEFLKNKVSKAILIFLLVGLVSLASGVLVTKTVVPHLGFLHWLRRIEYFIPFFLGVLAIKGRRKNLEFFLKVLMISITLALIYGLGQKYFEWPIIVTQNEEYAKGVALRYVAGGHINASFAGHYDLGTFLVLLLPLYISLFFIVRNFRARLALFIVVSAGLWLLAYSGSRISVFSYLLATTGALILIKKYKAIPLVILFSFLFFSFSPSLVARYSRIIEVTSEKILKINKVIFEENRSVIYAAEEENLSPLRRESSTPKPKPIPVFEDRSTSIRLNVEWPRAIRALSKNPLLGTGFSSITLATDNGYLRLLGEVGILGFLAFFLIFLRIGRLILNAFPLTHYKGVELAFLGGVIGSLPSLFLNAVFIDIFEASKFAIIFWLFMGFLYSLVETKKNE